MLSNGDWPVFYSAIERETAERESSYHYGRKAAGDRAARRAVHYSVVRCMFNGEIIDLLVKQTDWPELLSEDYTFCHGLGSEAHNVGLAGFFSPSARDSGGTTVPVFLAETLSSPVIEATAIMTYNTGKAVVEFIELS